MKAGVIHDGGFAEQGVEGRALQARIAAICVEAGSRYAVPTAHGYAQPAQQEHDLSAGGCASLPGWRGMSRSLSHSGWLCVAHIDQIGEALVQSANEFA